MREDLVAPECSKILAGVDYPDLFTTKPACLPC
jgi:hypothetical protein